MTRKVTYEFKTDKRGRKYANRIDLKTGKKTRIAYKLAQKRDRDIRYKENRRAKEKELKKKGFTWEEYQKEKKEITKKVKAEYKKKEKKVSREIINKEIEKEIEKSIQKQTKEKELAEKKGATWKEYQKEKKEIEKRIKKEYKEKGKEVSQETIDKKVEKEIEKTIGVRSRFRFHWRYWELPFCGTPTFVAYADAKDGDHYDEMKEYCNDIYDDIMQSNLCPDREVLGGACVVVYKRKHEGKKYDIVKQHELGDGCVQGIEKGM